MEAFSRLLEVSDGWEEERERKMKTTGIHLLCIAPSETIMLVTAGLFILI